MFQRTSFARRHHAFVQALEGRQLLSDADMIGIPSTTLADMNGDGKADLIGLTRHPAESAVSITVGLGRGDGSFVSTDRIVIRANTGLALGVGDLDGDGALDVAIAGDNPLSMAPINGTFVITAFGKGDGKFKRQMTSAGEAPVLQSTFVPQIARARALTLADLDNNGIGEVSVLGIARTSSTTTAAPAIVVNWDPSLPTLVAVPPTVVPFNSLVIINQLHVADLDADGRNDLVATNRTPMPPSLLTVVRNDLAIVRFPTDHSASVRLGLNPLNALPPTAPQPTTAMIETFGLGDLNGDGKVELIGRRDSILRYAPHGSNGQFGPVTAVLSANPPPVALTNFRASDITGDGRDDVLAQSRVGPVLATNITTTGNPVAVRWSRVPIPGLIGLTEEVLETPTSVI